MKKLTMVFVCLMTLINLYAQKYHPTIVSAYRNWAVYNGDNTIEDFIKIKWYASHRVSEWGSRAEVGSYARNIYEDRLKKYRKDCEEYVKNPTVNSVSYVEANHSQKYGHFEGVCLHEKDCKHHIDESGFETKYDRAKNQYTSFHSDCLICQYEIKMVGHLYEKLLKRRYKNWINSDDYKQLQNSEENRKIEYKKKENEAKDMNKNNFGEIMKRMKM